MIQKHCYECGTALTERELEGEGDCSILPSVSTVSFPDVQCGREYGGYR